MANKNFNFEVSRGSNVKFDNLDIQHSCDEGVTVRRKASIELENSRIVSYYNKGIFLIVIQKPRSLVQLSHLNRFFHRHHIKVD